MMNGHDDTALVERVARALQDEPTHERLLVAGDNKGGWEALARAALTAALSLPDRREGVALDEALEQCRDMLIECMVVLPAGYVEQCSKSVAMANAVLAPRPSTADRRASIDKAFPLGGFAGGKMSDAVLGPPPAPDDAVERAKAALSCLIEAADALAVHANAGMIDGQIADARAALSALSGLGEGK